MVRVEAGDRVPADGMLLEAQGVSVDESVLTGESVQARALFQRVSSRTSSTSRPGVVDRNDVRISLGDAAETREPAGTQQSTRLLFTYPRDHG